MSHTPIGKILAGLTRRNIGWSLEFTPHDRIVAAVLNPPAFPTHYLLAEGPHVHPTLQEALRQLRNFPSDPIGK